MVVLVGSFQLPLPHYLQVLCRCRFHILYFGNSHYFSLNCRLQRLQYETVEIKNFSQCSDVSTSFFASVITIYNSLKWLQIRQSMYDMNLVWENLLKQKKNIWISMHILHVLRNLPDPWEKLGNYKIVCTIWNLRIIWTA